MNFYEKKDIGYCGLACVLCSSDDCPGCKERGCQQGSDCAVYICAEKKGIDGCYECEGFPCGENMLQGIRVRAFNRYAKQFGKYGLTSRLKKNYKAGITYHTPDGLKGDYDVLATEQEIFDLVKFGKGFNPYIECPVFETENFILRLVKDEDAAELFECYSDQKTQRIINADNCPGGFNFSSVEETGNYIYGWINRAFADHFYIRFSIVDKQNNKAVGTVEMFDWTYQQTEGLTGILRIDLASAYETEICLKEIISVSYDNFCHMFDTDCIVTKAVPAASERVNALAYCGFEKYSDFLDGQRTDYYVKRKSMKASL